MKKRHVITAAVIVMLLFCACGRENIGNYEEKTEVMNVSTDSDFEEPDSVGQTSEDAEHVIENEEKKVTDMKIKITVGDIAYWAPGGSLVILYKQNGEEFEWQHLGHIDTGVEIFETTGDADVKFEVIE